MTAPTFRLIHVSYVAFLLCTELGNAGMTAEEQHILSSFKQTVLLELYLMRKWVWVQAKEGYWGTLA